MDRRIVEGRKVVALPTPRGYPPCKSCVFSMESKGGECPNTRSHSICDMVVFVDPVDAITHRLTGIYPLYSKQGA